LNKELKAPYLPEVKYVTAKTLILDLDLLVTQVASHNIPTQIQKAQQ
jgi:hypothetical protein